MQLTLPFHPITKRLFYLLGLKALILIALIFTAGIGLSPDEAQYWTWSQNLDWGYYSKPPGIAWQIWLGTLFFGQTEWGVRSITVILAFLQAWAIYLLALRAALSHQVAFWCSLIMAFSPLGILGSFFAITDVGFLLCWTVACIILTTALSQERPANPIAVGTAIFVGALFKWPIYLFWPFYLLCRHWYFPLQKLGKVVLGIAISLLGLLPSVWWNWFHDWATFRHVSATLQGGSGIKAEGNFLSFIGSQIALISPIIFVLFMIGLWQWLRQKKDLYPQLFFSGFVTLIPLICMAVVACFQKVQGNWIIFIYPTAIILIGYFFQQASRIGWIKMGLVFSFVLSMSAFLLPSFSFLPFHFNPFKHNVGWKLLEKTLFKHGYEPDSDFLFSDKYQTSSILSFYGQGQKRAYFLNLSGCRKNQFSYWPSLHEEQKGKTGYFLSTENTPALEKNLEAKRNFYQTELSKYFEKVEFLEMAPLLSEKSRVTKGALIFRCKNCKEAPPDSLIY